jgi:cytochrome c oxidase cbb3-type subunit III
MKKPKKMKIFNSFKLALKNTRWVFALVLFLSASTSYSQPNGDNSGTMMFVVGTVAIVSVLVLMVALYALQVIKKIAKNQPAGNGEEPSLWQRFLEIANNRASVEKEADILLDHNYDGIRELDNHLPPWWKWLFYITIIWGAIYLVGHHFMDWFPLQEEEYETEMALASTDAKAKEAANMEAGGFDETALVYSDDDGIIEAGKKIYVRKACNSCHGSAGEGNTIGPNLTDNYWIHGGSIKDVYTTIKKGVPDKGMISWESQLTPSEIRDIATYVLSLKGSNPPNAKAPQGKLYEGGEANNESSIDESKGKAIYDTNCLACHTADGGGVAGLGPNLTDRYWKNSNGSNDGVEKTIREGVAGTAMMAWGTLLNEEQIKDVTNYIRAFQGTTPANPKEPEGDLYEDTTEEEPTIEENPEETVANVSTDLSKGKSIFETTCAACHTADGGGVPGLGPNLTDKYWKNSNGSKEGIKKTIIDGVAGTAMMAWSASLSEDQIDALTNFILSLQGTTPANPKEPEGDLYE